MTRKKQEQQQPQPKKRITDLKSALQEIMATEIVEGGQTLTGAQTIAAALYSKAKDPESPDCLKAIEMIAKITKVNAKEQLEAYEQLLKIMRITEEPFGGKDADPQTADTYYRIREQTYNSL